MSVRHQEHEHVALLHEGVDDLARRASPLVAAALAGGDPVLVCVGDAAWAAMASELGPLAASVSRCPDGERYTTPGCAMAMVHGFAQGALAGGASRAWVLSAIPFDGDDDRWVRYEAAVNVVLAGVPLRSVCAYDTTVAAPALLAAALATHALVDDGEHGRRVSEAFGATVDSMIAEPGRPATHDVAVDSPGQARWLLSQGVAADLPPERLDAVLLVASELVTNALRHGELPVHLRAWRLDDEVVLDVRDHGPGLADPYPDLRPPSRSDGSGGFGLWLVGQVADRFDAHRDAGATVVRAGLRTR